MIYTLLHYPATKVQNTCVTLTHVKTELVMVHGIHLYMPVSTIIDAFKKSVGKDHQRIMWISITSVYLILFVSNPLPYGATILQ